MKRKQAKRKQRKRRRKQRRGFSDRVIRGMILTSRRLLNQGRSLSPSKRAKLKQLSDCKNCRQARRVIQRGGLLPILPLIAAAAPFIGKALLGVGAAAAGTAISSAVRKAINKKDG